jgi:hypothetical protein
MNQKFSIDKNSDDDIIYVNVSLCNNKSVSVPAQINLTLPEDILDPNYRYNSSIDRFSINGSSIPIRLFKDNYFYITMSFTGYVSVFSLPLSYNSLPTVASNNLFYPKPIFSYQELAIIINACMNSVFLGLQALVGGPLGPLAGALPPVFKFNVNTGKYEIYAQKSFYDDLSPSYISIFFNNQLFNLFQNFLVEFISENNLVNAHQDNRLIIRDMGLKLNETIIDAVTYLKMEQEYQNASSVNEPQQLLLISDSIGIKPEYTIPSGSGPNLTSTNFGIIPTSSLIADFQPNFDSLQSWVSTLVYLPAYRRIHQRKQLSSSRNFDLKILWNDNEGNNYLFYLEPGKSMSIKYVFEKIKN